jgi:hypothetical protein
MDARTLIADHKLVAHFGGGEGEVKVSKYNRRRRDSMKNCAENLLWKRKVGFIL